MALIHTINVGGVQYDVKATHYATCGTAASTTAKVATIQNGGFTLAAGVKVSVKFTYANSAANATLNINSTGAKNIRWRNANLPSDQYWAAGQIVDFVYDGSYWNVIGALNSSSADTSSFLKKTGDTMTGPLNLTQNVGYGSSLPASGETGQLFFLTQAGFDDLDDGPSLPIGGSEGQILVKNSSVDGDASWQDGNYLPLTGGTITGGLILDSQNYVDPVGQNFAVAIEGSDSLVSGIAVMNSTQGIILYLAPDGYMGLGDLSGSGIVYKSPRGNYHLGPDGVYANGSVLYGAAWNDYAEYRICKEDFVAGQAVCENGDDTLSISTERLQPGANIVSDTFGFAIGETDDAKCPIAVSGRVLAYTYEPREMFKAGDAVCAGPNGTISKMTREEIREYPERIIGTVSAIPNYDYWGTGNVKVNNRIWIKI